MVPLLPYAIGLSYSYNEIYPNCDEEFKPHSDMIFDSMEEGVEFSERYAHHVGFSARLSSETKKRESYSGNILFVQKKVGTKKKNLN